MPTSQETMLSYDELKRTLIQKFFQDMTLAMLRSIKNPEHLSCTPQASEEKHLVDLEKINTTCLRYFLSKQEGAAIKELLKLSLLYANDKISKKHLNQITQCFGKFSEFVIKEYDRMIKDVVDIDKTQEQKFLLVQYNSSKSNTHISKGNYIMILSMIFGIIAIAFLVNDQKDKISNIKLNLF